MYLNWLLQILKLQLCSNGSTTPHHLTPAHPLLLQLCLSAQCLKPALALLDTSIMDVTKEVSPCHILLALSNACFLFKCVNFCWLHVPTIVILCLAYSNVCNNNKKIVSYLKSKWTSPKRWVLPCHVTSY